VRASEPARVHPRQHPRRCRAEPERMKTDYLDVVQFHISPSKQTLEENGALEALQELKAAGKVRHIGMSARCHNLRDHIAMGVFDVFQISYSAMEREHEAIIATASDAGSGIVIRGGAAEGALRRKKGPAMGAVAKGETRGSAWRYDPDGVHPPLPRSATPTWTPPSSARRTRSTSRPISRFCGKGRRRICEGAKRRPPLPARRLSRRSSSVRCRGGQAFPATSIPAVAPRCRPGSRVVSHHPAQARPR
jgi:hypothetical protein